MRAWQVQGKGEPRDVMKIVELAPPDPGPDQLRIAVTAAGVGLPDVFMCRATYPLTPPLPFTPGQEAVGRVTAVGPGVDVAIGTRVMSVTAFTEGCGSFAEECLVGAGSTFPVPEGLSDAQAAGFWIPHLTAWIGLVDRGQVRENEWLAVLGAAGGSGIAAVQLGRALGARVIAVVSSQPRAEFCRELGAEETIVDGGGDVAAELRRITNGHGVDAIYDPVGGSQAEAAAKALARGGRLLAVGFASGRWPQLHTHDLLRANASLVGVFAGGYSRAELDDMHAQLSKLIADGRLHNAVTAEVPFDELATALQRMADRHVVGKLVMVA